MVIILAVGLSMDSFAVSIGCGLTERMISFRYAVKIAFSLAFFQGLLPVVGWYVGEGIEKYVEGFDHWIAFFLLAYLGLRMIIESQKEEGAEKMSDIYSWRHIITISIATSIDALIVGFSYALGGAGDIFIGAIIIGAVTFFFSMLGIRIGKDVGNRFGNKVEFIGGVILFGIGLKIFLEHMLDHGIGH
jgi:putative Mn2+ efflux pump MntP